MKRILLVEDDKLSALVTQSRLEALSYHVTVAYTGKEALERYPEGFELILLDLGLPDITGFDVARSIRANEGPSQPMLIIVLTLMGVAEAEEACRNAGIDDYISKPLNRAKLTKMAEHLNAIEHN